MVSECSSWRPWRSASAFSFCDSSANNNAPKVALAAINTHRGAVQPPQLAVVGRHETVAGLASDQGAAVEKFVRALAGDPFIAVPLLHVALDQHEQMCRRMARRQQHLAGGHCTMLRVPAHQRLLLADQAVEGRMGEVMGEVERVRRAEDPTTRT